MKTNARRFVPFIIALLVSLSSPAAVAEEPMPVAPENLVYCTVCHGVQLMGNETLKAPRLSGMDQWYVARQLRGFRKGWRGSHPEDFSGMEMRPMAEALTEQGVTEAAAFVASTHSPAPLATVDGDATEGESLYAACAACHAADGRGNEDLAAPALAGQNDWYLLQQLDKYRQGIRGGHPDDTYGQQMRASAQLLDSDQAVRDVVAYINSLTNN